MAYSDDVDAVGSVHVRAWQAAYPGVMPDEYLDNLNPNDRAAMWARFFEQAQPDRRLKVITFDCQVVGFAFFGACPESPEELLGELFAINLDPEHWERGLGRTLLSEVTHELVAFGDEAVLWVVPQNARARGLYESEAGSTTEAVATTKCSGCTSTKCGTGSPCARSRRSRAFVMGCLWRECRIRVCGRRRREDVSPTRVRRRSRSAKSAKDQRPPTPK